MKKEEFIAVVTPIAELVDQKHKDYNSNTKLTDYFPFGDYSYVHMLHTKMLRITNLTKKADPKEGLPVTQFESIKDSVDDLIAYAVFYRDFLGKK